MTTIEDINNDDGIFINDPITIIAQPIIELKPLDPADDGIVPIDTLPPEILATENIVDPKFRTIV